MASVYKRSRSPFWQARIVVGGVARRISTKCTTEKAAQRAADEVEDELNRMIITSADMRLQDASNRFFSTKNLRPKTLSNYKCSLKKIKEKLGDFPLRLLDRDRIKHYVEVRSMETGSVAIRRDLAFLSSLYSMACNWPNGPDTNPVKIFDKSFLPEAKVKTRWLTMEEYQRLLEACKLPVHRRVITLLLETGMRIQELLNLQWSEVDLTNRQIIIFGDRTKNGDYRIVPMTQVAYDTLVSTQGSGYVFVNSKTKKRYTTFKKTMVGIAKRAEVPDCTIHTLRHTFASWAIQRGMGEITLQHWLGHKTRSMTKRYAKPSYDSLQQAAKMFSDSTLYSTQLYNSTRNT